MEEAITRCSKRERREPFQESLTPSLAEWTEAWQWKSMGVPRRRLVSRASRETHLIPAKGHIEDFDDNCRQYLPMMRHGFGTWREYRSYRQCLWMVERKRNRWFCTCPVGIKSGHCKHTLGMAIVRGCVDCPEEAKTIPIGRKRKRGRPSRISGPLVRDAGQ